MARKGEKATKREAEAGKRNLEIWLKKNPSRGNLKHGGYSKIIREKYRDAGTAEGKFLKAQIDSLISDIKRLTPAQELIIGRIADKLIILKQFGDYIEAQADMIIDEEGSAIPCVDAHLRYGRSLLRDLDLLYKEI
jgi:hypothetical protein